MTGMFYKSYDGKSYLAEMSIKGEVLRLKAASFEGLLGMLKNYIKGSTGWVPIGQIKLEDDFESS